MNLWAHTRMPYEKKGKRLWGIGGNKAKKDLYGPLEGEVGSHKYNIKEGKSDQEGRGVSPFVTRGNASRKGGGKSECLGENGLEGRLEQG